MQSLILPTLKMCVRTGLFFSAIFWITGSAWCLELTGSIFGQQLRFIAADRGLIVTHEPTPAAAFSLHVTDRDSGPGLVHVFDPIDGMGPFGWRGEVPNRTSWGVQWIAARGIHLLATFHPTNVAFFAILLGLLSLFEFDQNNGTRNPAVSTD